MKSFVPMLLAGVAALPMLAGCASGTSTPSAHGPVTEAPRGPAMDASYDWHGQVIVPFGVLLKSSPVPLHEVLLFRDDAARNVDTQGTSQRGADPENKDCYAIDGTPPRLVGQTPDAYLLCFDHDRLNRIESTVHLPAETASLVFAQACASWQAGHAPADQAAGVCEGHSGTTTFTSHLAAGEPGQSSALSLVLSNANPAP